MKIILFHPLNSHNTGDGVILRGTENLLKEAFGNVDFIYQEFRDAEERQEVTYQKHDADLLVVSGTPWFWETCRRSVKYQELSKIVALYPDMKKVGMGLGSCYPIRTSIVRDFIKPDMEAVEKGNGDWRFDDILKIRETFGKFSLLMTRDPVAQRLLKVTGLTSYEVACPAAYAHEGKPEKKTKSLLIFQDPKASISKESCGGEFSRQYIDFQLKLVERYGMEIITASSPDSDWLIKNGVMSQPTFIKSPDEMFSVLDTCSLVVSCRVHEAIPARVSGALTYILPMDTRFLTATKLGVIPLWTYGYPLDLLEIGRPNIDRINSFTQTEMARSKTLIIEKLRGLIS